MTSRNFRPRTNSSHLGESPTLTLSGCYAELTFLSSDGAPTTVNTLKDMLAGLPQFQEGKEAFGLHLDMVEKCVKIFQDHKLLDVSSVEQASPSPQYCISQLTRVVPRNRLGRGQPKAQKSCGPARAPFG